MSKITSQGEGKQLEIHMVVISAPEGCRGQVWRESEVPLPHCWAPEKMPTFQPQVEGKPSRARMLNAQIPKSQSLLTMTHICLESPALHMFLAPVGYLRGPQPPGSKA